MPQFIREIANSRFPRKTQFQIVDHTLNLSQFHKNHDENGFFKIYQNDWFCGIRHRKM